MISDDSPNCCAVFASATEDKGGKGKSGEDGRDSMTVGEERRGDGLTKSSAEKATTTKKKMTLGEPVGVESTKKILSVTLSLSVTDQSAPRTFTPSFTPTWLPKK